MHNIKKLFIFLWMMFAPAWAADDYHNQNQQQPTRCFCDPCAEPCARSCRACMTDCCVQYNTCLESSCLCCLHGSFNGLMSILTAGIEVRNCLANATAFGIRYICPCLYFFNQEPGHRD